MGEFNFFLFQMGVHRFFFFAAEVNDYLQKVGEGHSQ